MHKFQQNDAPLAPIYNHSLRHTGRHNALARIHTHIQDQRMRIKSFISTFPRHLKVLSILDPHDNVGNLAQCVEPKVYVHHLHFSSIQKNRKKRGGGEVEN